MKTKILILIALICIMAGGARAQLISTTVIGNSSYTNSLIIKTAGLCKLYAVDVYNSSGSTAYVQIFQTNAIPANGSVAVFSYPVSTLQFLSYDFSYYGADLYPGCTVCISSTANTLTLGSASFGIQAVIKSN